MQVLGTVRFINSNITGYSLGLFDLSELPNERVLANVKDALCNVELGKEMESKASDENPMFLRY